MKLNVPKNPNYCVSVVKINTIIPLENSDNLVAALIMGNQVIVTKDVKVGDVGLYFPLESQLSDVYLSTNNLYTTAELNKDQTKKGFFEKNGRVRCIRLRGNKSEGLFMPLESVKFALSAKDSLQIGDEFDELNGIQICQKYFVVKKQNQQGMGGPKNKKLGKKVQSKLIENQFRLHQDTSMMFRNLHRVQPDDIISVSYKVHGTSAVSSKVLCKKPLKLYETVLKKLGVNVVDTRYDYIFSSRNTIKNTNLNEGAQSFYTEDIWGITHNELKEFLQDGMTIYYEVVGFLPNGGAIQKDYDYGCKQGEHKIMVYRITYTNTAGRVFEYSAKQVQDWCKTFGVGAVPELFYGRAKDLFDENYTNEGVHMKLSNFDIEKWREGFLQTLKDKFNEKDCYICKNAVPEEGCVIRMEKNEFEAYKCKSNRFYERETKQLDKGESNIEDEN